MLSAVTLQLLIVNSTQVHSATVNQVLTITVVHICVTITIVHICVTDKLCRRVMVCTALNGRKDLPLFSSLPSAYADDEVLTSLLHLLRSLARTVAVVKSSLHSSNLLLHYQSTFSFAILCFCFLRCSSGEL